MRSRLLPVVLASLLLPTWMSAQVSSGWIPTATAPAPSSGSTPTAQASSPAPAASSTSSKSPGSPTPSTSTTSGSDSDSDEMTSDDFLIDGVPYAKVLYLEGNVWIRPPDEDEFHKLEADEPIPDQSVLYTGYNGILDFATGPGMAVRMVPKTGLVVDVLPKPNSSSTAPATSQVDLRKGTIFSALGRENGGAIDYTVQTPMGVAAARGTMFSTSVIEGTTQVSMLHGTVNFQSPDHQTSQITAGQSQQITGSGNKFHFGAHNPMKPANSEAFFNHAGGLLDHASGYGVVRHGLGPDVAKEMDKHGYKMPSGARDQMQHAGKNHYKTKPQFNHAKTPQARTANQHKTTSTGGTGYHPAGAGQGQEQKPKTWHKPGENEHWPEKDKDWGH